MSCIIFILSSANNVVRRGVIMFYLNYVCNGDNNNAL